MAIHIFEKCDERSSQVFCTILEKIPLSNVGYNKETRLRFVTWFYFWRATHGANAHNNDDDLNEQ
jgi:hypothetical protein